MDSFTVKPTKSGVRVFTRSADRSVKIAYVYGFPAALLRGMIEVIRSFGSVILPTDQGTYIVKPIPGEDAVMGTKHGKPQKER